MGFVYGITWCYGQRAVTGGKGTNSLSVKAAICSRWCQPKVFDKKKPLTAGKAVCSLKERCDGSDERNRELTAKGVN